MTYIGTKIIPRSLTRNPVFRVVPSVINEPLLNNDNRIYDLFRGSEISTILKN